MNAETLTALKESIAHWRRLATGTQEPGEEPRSDCCALCLQFHSAHQPGRTCCEGCPVFLKTNMRCCRLSPFTQAADAWAHHGLESIQFKIAAHKELGFLISLLPEGESA